MSNMIWFNNILDPKKESEIYTKEIDTSTIGQKKYKRNKVLKKIIIIDKHNKESEEITLDV